MKPLFLVLGLSGNSIRLMIEWRENRISANAARSGDRRKKSGSEEAGGRKECALPRNMVSGHDLSLRCQSLLPIDDRDV